MKKIDIKVPSPGESINEVQIASWLVKSGDFVTKDNEIAEIDSEKATIALAAPISGIIDIKIEEGSIVKVGETIAVIEESEGHSETEKPETIQPKKEKAKSEITKDKLASNTTSKTSQGEKAKLSPVARKLLEAEGLSDEDFLNYVKNTRFDTKEVKEFLYSKDSVQKAPTISTERKETSKPMSMLRKKLAQRLVAVKNETAMLTTFNELDMSAVSVIRNKYKDIVAEKHDIKLGFMSFFVKAVSISLMENSAVNAMIKDDEIIHYNYADIGVAVSTEKGLMVPVVRNAQNMNLIQIEKEIARLADKARQGKISLDDLSGGTFTISNGGVFGSMLSTPILNPPQSAILGMHNIIDRPIAKNGEVIIAPMMYLALSYDHRIIDGKESVTFLKRIKELLENPEFLLTGDHPVEKLLDL
ncbi:MAG: 2-oxoglutarate dehydrogenase complex dihydrolipoyllysine-residue succinyltransferase [Bacteroidales bacterium]|nr:2-oxoglutarate dehydrogenase complex dihydrolipoyllysine-residue succinyltransferase [Bacteroidales bacterium]